MNLITNVAMDRTSFFLSSGDDSLMEADAMRDACKELWVAVLGQAIKDTRGDTTGHRGHHRPILREAARAWFGSENREVGSFLWICEILECNPKFALPFME